MKFDRAWERKLLKEDAEILAENDELTDDFFRRFHWEYTEAYLNFKSQNLTELEKIWKTGGDLELEWFKQIEMGLNLVNEDEEINLSLINEFQEIDKNNYYFEELEEKWGLKNVKKLNIHLQFLLNFYKLKEFRKIFYEKNLNMWNDKRNLFKNPANPYLKSLGLLTTEIPTKNIFKY